MNPSRPCPRSLAVVGALFAAALLAPSLGCGGTPPMSEAMANVPRETQPQATADDVHALNRARLAMGLAMHRQLAAENQQQANLVASPYSLAVVLGMLHAGAGGATAEQLQTAMHLPESLAGHGLHPAANLADLQLAKAVQQARDLTLQNAARHFVQAGYPIQQPYLTTLATHYGSGLYQLDFASHPSGARAAINDWVAEQTQNKIRNVLPESAVTTDTRLVLVNALYLDAKWAQPFQAESTRPRPFTTLGGEQAEVPMMHDEKRLRALRTADGWTVAALPYRGNTFDLVVMLPPAEADVRAVEAELVADTVWGWLDAVDAADFQAVNVAMPTVDTRSRFNLVSTLQALGVRDAFDDRRADFSAITEAERLVVGAAGQETWLRIDEEGTQAAAATYGGVDVTAEEVVEPLQLRLDRPFFLLLRARESRAPLFFGRIGDPRE